MSLHADRDMLNALKLVPKWSGAAVSALGFIVLMGWIFDIPALKSPQPGLISMKANTAIGFILAGISLWLLREQPPGGRESRIARGVSCAVALLGMLTLCEYFFGWDLSIDQLLVREPAGAMGTVIPGRMAPNTALCFLLNGLSMLFLDTETAGGRRPARYLAIPPLMITLLALFGYIYGAPELAGLVSHTKMALHTSISFLVLSLGIICARPDAAIAILTSQGPGGGIARRLLPPAFVIPVLIGWLLLKGEHAGHFNAELGLALFVVLVVFVFVVMIWRICAGLDRAGRERKASEMEREVSQYTRSLIEASLDPLVTISAEGKITDVNEATTKVTGIPREGLIGSDFSTYFTEPDKAREGYRQVFAKGSVTDYPLTIGHRDGRLTDVLYNAAVYKDAEGKTMGVFAAARDVTAQKQAFQYARSLLEASLDPLVTISAEGKITDVNEATVKVTGVARENLIGTDFSNYFTEPDKAREGYRQVFDKGFVTDYPLTIRHKDKTLTDVLYNASVYRDVAGKVLGVFAAARDVTERKRAEEALKELNATLEHRVHERTEELARSNAELEQFAYVASHDLQEPLRMVSSYVQLLERRYKGRLDRDADEFIAFAVDGAARMQVMINDLLAYSRVSTRGKTFEEINLELALNQALENLHLAINERNTKVTRDPLPMVYGDLGQLTQVFQNLIDNGIKFRGEAAPMVHVSAAREGGDWVCSVRDNGIGIAPEYVDRLFVLFQRLHTRKDYPGTGIGLAICKRIVERHGGRIWVESRPGEGSTFYFRIGTRETTVN